MWTNGLKTPKARPVRHAMPAAPDAKRMVLFGVRCKFERFFSAHFDGLFRLDGRTRLGEPRAAELCDKGADQPGDRPRQAKGPQGRAERGVAGLNRSIDGNFDGLRDRFATTFSRSVLQFSLAPGVERVNQARRFA